MVGDMELKGIELDIVLTKNNLKEFTVRDYLEALQNIGVKKGDTICVHSQIFNFGLPVCDKETLLKYFCKILLDSIGEKGTLIMPEFSYSFCRDEAYNIQETPSTVGLLTEYFRKYPGVKRTKHPIFSFSILGERQKEFLDISWDAFDENESVYGKMLQSNDKIVLFGAPKGYTFYYLSEQSVRVKHRYFKNFSGMIIDGDKQYSQTVPYYVRNLDMRSIEDQRKVNAFLYDNHMLNTVNICGGSIRLFHCKEAFEICRNRLKEDEKFFLI